MSKVLRVQNASAQGANSAVVTFVEQPGANETAGTLRQWIVNMPLEEAGNYPLNASFEVSLTPLTQGH